MVKINILIALAFAGSECRPASALEYCDRPVPVVVPGQPTHTGATSAPSDAIILFDGQDLSEWTSHEGSAHWDVANGVVTVNKSAGNIETTRAFDDVQLHIEWRVPENIRGEGQARGNSGVFFQGRYELQILDSFKNPTYPDGQAGAIYRQSPPIVNAMRRPGEWNIYDAIFIAPRFNDDGTLFSPARLTVLHNGVLIQNNTEVRGNTITWRPDYVSHGPAALVLQAHSDPSQPISFRNIWVRELGKDRTSITTSDKAPAQHLTGALSLDTRVKDLLANPKTHEFLGRCFPEIVPVVRSQAALDLPLRKIVEGLVGTLSSEQFARIAEALDRAQTSEPDEPPPK